MADDLSPIFAEEQNAPPAPPTVTETDLLRQQLHFQNQLLTHAIGAKERPPEPPSTAPPQWQDQDFITPDDARLILDSPGEQFPQRLNRAVNAAVKTVHDRMQEEIMRRDEQIAATREELNTRWQSLEAQRATEFWNASFYNTNPDLRDDTDLVQQATRMVADYVAKQPWVANDSSQVLGAIAYTARSLRTQKLQRWSGMETSAVTMPPTASPARRAQVESGGTTRVGVARDANPDFQKQALADMLKHVRGGN